MQSALEDEYGGLYLPGPWFEFYSSGVSHKRWCQPDGLLFQPYDHTITIIEIKLQHTADAWWQTKMLYLPVVAAVFPPELWCYNICEIVKWLDPATHFPWPTRRVGNLAMLKMNDFGIHIMRLQ